MSEELKSPSEFVHQRLTFSGRQFLNPTWILFSFLIVDTWWRCRTCRPIRSERSRTCTWGWVKSRPLASSLQPPCWTTAIGASPRPETTLLLAKTACRDWTCCPLQVGGHTTACTPQRCRRIRVINNNNDRMSPCCVFVQVSWGRAQSVAAAADLRREQGKAWPSPLNTAAWWVHNLLFPC